MKNQTWMIQYLPMGTVWNNQPGWYYGTMYSRGELTNAAVGPFDSAPEACMDLTRAFVTADAMGPVEDREEGDV